MPWEKVDLKVLAKRLGINYAEVREKHNLIEQIIKIREKQGQTQAQLAKQLGVSQARIAKIESGIGTRTVTFDVLLNILTALGYDYKVTTKKKIAA